MAPFAFSTALMASALLWTAAARLQPPASRGERVAAVSSAETVHVAPPSSRRDADRASIIAALERVGPGGTIQFAAGTYVVGELIRVRVPQVTLIGHPSGTTLRGCDPAEFVKREVAGIACNGFELAGEQQSVRNLTFEYAWHGLVLGCCISDPDAARTGGGHRVEGNTFRRSSNGIRLIGDAPEPSVIRNNRFINLYHAVVVHGMTAHILDNDISAPEPEQVPIAGLPSFGLSIAAMPGPPGAREAPPTNCSNNIIAGNRVDGHPDAIVLYLARPGAGCRHNIIRDNTIAFRQIKFVRRWIGVTVRSEGDSSVVGVPLILANVVSDSSNPGAMENNVIEGNRVIGAEGLAIEILHASRNRIENNTITRVRRRDPFPGNTLRPAPQWREGNGSGIWLSRGSDENEIRGNTFSEIAGSAVVLEGKGNQVATRSASDSVRDLGTGNRVTRPR